MNSEKDPHHDSFVELYEREHQRIRMFFLLHGVLGHEVDDHTQKVFVRAFIGWPAFLHKSSPKTWLHRIATRVLANSVRDLRAKKRHGKEVSFDEAWGERDFSLEVFPPRTGGSSLEALLGKERRETLRAAIHNLPGKTRRCMTMYLYRGQRYSEIAENLKISMSAVKARIHEGKKRLNEVLRDSPDI